MGGFLGLLGKGLKGYGKSVGRGVRSDLEQGMQGILDPLQRRKKPSDIPLPAPEVLTEVEGQPAEQDYGFGVPGAVSPPLQVDPEEERRRRMFGYQPYAGGMF